MFALDTNTLIYYFKGMGGVAARLGGCTPSEIGIPIVVVYELETGIAKSQQPRNDAGSSMRCWPSPDFFHLIVRRARQSATLRASPESKGTSPGPLDCLIAGIALAQGAIFVNAQFRRVRPGGGVAGGGLVLTPSKTGHCPMLKPNPSPSTRPTRPSPPIR